MEEIRGKKLRSEESSNYVEETNENTTWGEEIAMRTFGWG